MYTICIQGVCFLLTIDMATDEIEEARLRERWEATLLTKTRDFGRKGFKCGITYRSYNCILCHFVRARSWIIVPCTLSLLLLSHL